MIKNIGIILAGGIGTRFGEKKPKQYYKIFGKELIEYSIDAFKNSKETQEIIVVLNEQEYNNKRIENKYNVKTVLGGKTRNESFKNALDYIKENYNNCKKIIENNAACPMIQSELIDKYFNLLDEYDAISTTYKITDALGCYNTKNISREDYYLIQSPDAYKFEIIYKYFDINSKLGHPAQMLPDVCKEYLYFDFTNNIKVTTKSDVEIVKKLMKRKK